MKSRLFYSWNRGFAAIHVTHRTCLIFWQAFFGFNHRECFLLLNSGYQNRFTKLCYCATLNSITHCRLWSVTDSTSLDFEGQRVSVSVVVFPTHSLFGIKGRRLALGARQVYARYQSTKKETTSIHRGYYSDQVYIFLSRHSFLHERKFISMQG